MEVETSAIRVLLIMLSRCTSLTMIVVIAVAPMVCCGYGLGLFERSEICCADVGDADDGCGGEGCGDETHKPGPCRNCPCDEDCQCVCAGAVLAGSWNDAMLKATWCSPSPDTLSLHFGGLSPKSALASIPPPDSGSRPSGRVIRTQHQSLLC